MKKVEWVTPNRMKFESLHKSFNKQTKCISVGNQIASTVVSSYIRPYSETECNGQKFPEGYLQECDLNWIVKDAPGYVKDYIRENGKNKTFILYLLFHWYKNKKIMHGAIITDEEHNYVNMFLFRQNRKSLSILEEVKKYVCN
ncbi:hypothetical protein DRJ17_05770 [Candidatus Woesearchaeota archaeon]|nr:MAG: hypothetical protein DRJ17_05770 [Candidatus Woesearchaeota archaeon]